MKLAIIVLLIGGTALAQSPAETPSQPVRHAKRLWTAYAISEAAVVGPMLIAGIGQETLGEAHKGFATTTLGLVGAAGLVLGPSAGHWYAGEGLTTGLVLRVGAAAAGGWFAIRDPHLQHVSTGFGLAAAAGLWVSGLAWDVVTMPRAVERFNRAHSTTIAPMITASGLVPGLAVGGAF